MVTIQATGTIKDNKINWLFDGQTLKQARSKARSLFAKNSIDYHTYIIV